MLFRSRLTPPKVLISNLVSKQQLLETKFQNYLQNIINRKEVKLNSLDKLLEASSFNRVLDRGFSLVMNNKGKPIKLSSEAPKNANVKIKFSDNIKSIRYLIKGNFKKSIFDLKLKMNSLSKNLEYEKAQDIKEKIDILKNYQAKSTIVNSKISNVDVFALVSDESYAYINFLQISYGAVIRSFTLEVKKKLEETDAEILRLAIIDLKQRFSSESKEVIVPFEINLPKSIKLTVPKSGDKKRLVDLSERNAKFYRIDKLKQTRIVDPEAHINRILQQAKKDLQLDKKPAHIECFDNSNLGGTNPVASCVVFKNGKPSKKDYRQFKIQNIHGPDDFASMEQVI